MTNCAFCTKNTPDQGMLDPHNLQGNVKMRYSQDNVPSARQLLILGPQIATVSVRPLGS